MKRVLALVGSPRRGGNTDILVEEVLKGAQEGGADAEKIFLADLTIGGCQGCGACVRNEVDWCIQKDDMTDLYPRILAADVIVLGTPIYWWGPSAQLKAFFDRWYALNGDKRTQLKGKQVALVCAMGDTDPATARHVIGMFQDSFSYLEMQFENQLVVSAHTQGEVSQNKEAMAEAWNLGNYLA
jgi:multimeric flavodoxin WrbA